MHPYLPMHPSKMLWSEICAKLDIHPTMGFDRMPSHVRPLWSESVEQYCYDKDNDVASVYSLDVPSLEFYDGGEITVIGHDDGSDTDETEIARMEDEDHDY